MSKKIGLLDVKAALRDPRFRDQIPPELRQEVSEWLQNPSCPCHVPLYRKLLSKEYAPLLRNYFPGGEVVDEAEETANMSKNHWTVINCHIDELEARLKALPPGRKQLDVARYDDQVTAVVNELDFI